VRTKAKEEQTKEINKSINETKHTVDSETIMGNIFYDAKEKRVELDFKRKWYGIYETRVAGVRDKDVLISVSQLGGELIIEMREEGEMGGRIGEVGRGANRRAANAFASGETARSLTLVQDTPPP